MTMTDDLKQSIKNLLKVRDLVYLSIGFALAVFVCWFIFNWRMNEVTFQGSMVYKNKVYSVSWDSTKIKTEYKEANK